MAKIEQLKADFDETQDLIQEKARLIASSQNTAGLNMQMQQNLLNALVERAKFHQQLRKNPPTKAMLDNTKLHIDTSIDQIRDFLEGASGIGGSSLMQVSDAADAFSNAQNSLLG